MTRNAQRARGAPETNMARIIGTLLKEAGGTASSQRATGEKGATTYSLLQKHQVKHLFPAFLPLPSIDDGSRIRNELLQLAALLQVFDVSQGAYVTAAYEEDWEVG